MSSIVRIITVVLIFFFVLSSADAEEFGEKDVSVRLMPFQVPKLYLGYSNIEKLFERLQFTYNYLNSNDIAAIRIHPILSIPQNKKQFVLTCSWNNFNKKTEPVWYIEATVPINIETMAFTYHTIIYIQENRVAAYEERCALPLHPAYEDVDYFEKENAPFEGMGIYYQIGFHSNGVCSGIRCIHDFEEKQDNISFVSKKYFLLFDESGRIKQADEKDKPAGKFPTNDKITGIKSVKWADWMLNDIHVPSENTPDKVRTFFQNIEKIVVQKRNLFCFLTGLADHPLFTKELGKAPSIRVLVDSGEIKEISALVSCGSSGGKSYCKGYHMWFSRNRLKCFLFGDFANVINEPFGKLENMLSDKKYILVQFHPTAYPASYKTVVKNRLFGRQIEWDEKGNVISDIDLDIPKEIKEKK